VIGVDAADHMFTDRINPSAMCGDKIRARHVNAERKVLRSAVRAVSHLGGAHVVPSNSNTDTHHSGISDKLAALEVDVADRKLPIVVVLSLSTFVTPLHKQARGKRFAKRRETLPRNRATAYASNWNTLFGKYFHSSRRLRLHYTSTYL